MLDGPDLVSCALAAVPASANANTIASLDMARLSRVSVMIGEEVGATMSAQENDQQPRQMPDILRSMDASSGSTKSCDRKIVAGMSDAWGWR